MTAAPRGWDFPTRAFHWTLATLIVFSFVTGRLDGSWLQWHFKSGYAVLALIIFRLAWGFAGSHDARFASFVRGPGAAMAHVRAVASGKAANHSGHNPLGGWMIVAMLLVVAFQAITGLFSNDDSSTEGPLASKVSDTVVDRMSALHSWNEWVIVGAVILHVAAILFYQYYLRMNIVGPMVRGTSTALENIRALVFICIASAAVYWLVEVYPK